MKRLSGAVATALFFAPLLGCAEEVAYQLPQEPVERTIQMGEEVLFKSHDDWIFKYFVDGVACYVVGEDIPFVERRADSLAVDCRLGQIMHVSTSGRHRIVKADIQGFTEVNMEIAAGASLKVILQDVLDATPALRIDGDN